LKNAVSFFAVADEITQHGGKQVQKLSCSLYPKLGMSTDE